MDYSGLRCFVEVKRILEDAKMTAIFTGLSKEQKKAFRKENVLESQERMDELAEEWDTYETSKDTQHESPDFFLRTEVDMDRAAEFIENRTLLRAAKLRQNWLLFESFQKVHVEAQLKTKHKVFDEVLGGSAGSGLYAFANHFVYEPGEFIVTEGEANNAVYLLQQGKVTAYTAITSQVDDEAGEHHDFSNGVVKRLRTMTEGTAAVINDDMLFRNVIVKHSVVADERCVIWKLTRRKLMQMEHENPALACHIHRYILRFTLTCRERLEKEVTTMEELHHNILIDPKKKALKDKSDKKMKIKDAVLAGTGKTHSSHGLSSMIMQKIQQKHWNWVHQKYGDRTQSERKAAEKEEIVIATEQHTLAKLHDAQHHHGHRFHHIRTALEIAEHDKEESKIMEERPWWLNVKPHLSVQMRDNAIKYFDFWSDDYFYAQHEEELKDEMIVVPRRSMSSLTNSEKNSNYTKNQSLNRTASMRNEDDADNILAGRAAGVEQKRKQGAQDKKLVKLIKVENDDGTTSSPRARRMDPFLSPALSGNSGSVSPRLSPGSPRRNSSSSPRNRLGGSPSRGSFGANALTQLELPGSALGSAEESDRDSVNSGGRDSSISVTSNGERRESDGKEVHRFIGVDVIQKALMDLGLYPTLKEVTMMHRILHHSSSDTGHRDKADNVEFLEMVELLTLADIDDRAFKFLILIFLFSFWGLFSPIFYLLFRAAAPAWLFCMLADICYQFFLLSVSIKSSSLFSLLFFLSSFLPFSLSSSLQQQKYNFIKCLNSLQRKSQTRMMQIIYVTMKKF